MFNKFASKSFKTLLIGSRSTINQLLFKRQFQITSPIKSSISRNSNNHLSEKMNDFKDFEVIENLTLNKGIYILN